MRSFAEPFKFTAGRRKVGKPRAQRRGNCFLGVTTFVRYRVGRVVALMNVEWTRRRRGCMTSLDIDETLRDGAGRTVDLALSRHEECGEICRSWSNRAAHHVTWSGFRAGDEW